MISVRAGAALVAAALFGVLGTAAISLLADAGAGALLYPTRTNATRPAPAGCREQTFSGVDVMLSGWQCSGKPPRRGTIVYLHGVADNRGSAEGVIARFVPRGYDVIAYDSRAHGASTGEHCTYGFYEKQDVHRVLDQTGVLDAVLIGHSLGAAVALQAAVAEPRISAVVAASTFSDLRTIAKERAPSVFFPWALTAAFARAERDGHFIVDDVSPLFAAGQISVPVLVIHGDQDRDTRPAHAQQIFDALPAAKRLLIVDGAGHNDVLRATVWTEIETWIGRYASGPSQVAR
jgi:uncharacterized protein